MSDLPRFLKITYPYRRWGMGFERVTSRLEHRCNDVVWLSPPPKNVRCIAPGPLPEVEL